MPGTYAHKQALKVAKLLGLNPPDLSNVAVEVIYKVIKEAMHEQSLSNIRAINEIASDEKGKVLKQEVIDKINLE